MLILAPFIAYFIVIGLNFTLGLIHGVICLRLIETYEYSFNKVTKRRVTLNSLYPSKDERRRRRMKTRAEMQWIETAKIGPSAGRVMGHFANGIFFILRTLNWAFVLGLPVYLVWYYSSAS